MRTLLRFADSEVLDNMKENNVGSPGMRARDTLRRFFKDVTKEHV